MSLRTIQSISVIILAAITLVIGLDAIEDKLIRPYKISDYCQQYI